MMNEERKARVAKFGEPQVFSTYFYIFHLLLFFTITKNKTICIRAKPGMFQLPFNWSRIDLVNYILAKIMNFSLIITKNKCCDLSRVWS